MELRLLLEGLSRPESFPYPVAQVDVRQTHISLVFLAGPFVYKIKKPVNFGWVDFSTLEIRLHFCQEEVRLNRRLAPAVYLGVVPVTRTEQGLQFEGQGEVVEWAVKMQRLPESATLHDRLQREGVPVELVQSLARRIAAFHQQGISGDLRQYGTFEAVAHNVLDIYRQAEAQRGLTVRNPVFDRLWTLTQAELDRHRALIDDRAGLVRDGHGDLHLDHVYCFPERQPPADLVIVDCIEFNEHFRYLDPVADMAFAVMDFRFHGRSDLARAFADAYFQASADEGGRQLLPLYAAYRASVRGTVEGLKLAEKEVPLAERAAELQSARGHWLLALADLETPGRRPCLLATAGLPGTGKSRLAAALEQHAGFTVIRSDVVRQQLAPPIGPAERYTPEWIEKTYAECWRRAADALFAGQRVLIDATLRQEHHRQAFLDLAHHWGVAGLILLCQSEPDIVRQRLEQRRGDASEADLQVYLHLAQSWEEPAPRTRKAIRTVDTNASAEQVLESALTVLHEQEL